MFVHNYFIEEYEILFLKSTVHVGGGLTISAVSKEI